MPLDAARLTIQPRLPLSPHDAALGCSCKLGRGCGSVLACPSAPAPARCHCQSALPGSPSLALPLPCCSDPLEAELVLSRVSVSAVYARGIKLRVARAQGELESWKVRV